MLATMPAEEQKLSPQAEHATFAPMLAEAALVLMRATHCTLRRPQLK